jgi:hypothetical protein
MANDSGWVDVPENHPVASATPSASPTATPHDDAGWVDVPAPAERTGFLGAAGSRIMDTVYGTGQLIQHLNPFASPETTAAMDANLKKRREQLERERSVPSATVTETTLDPQGRATHTRPLAERGNPAATLGDLAADVANPVNYLGPGRLLGAGTVLRRIGGAALDAGLVGAEQPATKGPSYWSEKGAQVGTAATTGASLPALGEAAAALRRWAWGKFGTSAEDQATQRIYKRIERDVKGGGPTTQDMLDLLNLTPGSPQSLMDVSGENVGGLTGKVLRQPGAGRQSLTSTLRARDAAATDRISGQIDTALASDQVKPSEAVQGLQQARSIAAKPLWDDAMAGGSIAPLKQQFQNAWVDAGRVEKAAQQALADVQQDMTKAAAKVQRAGNDVYLANSALAEQRAVQSRLQAAQHALQTASADKQTVLDMLNQAQYDIDQNVPGAVWSPRLQQFLDAPEVKVGLRNGLKMERQKALAEGRRLNPTEYAVVGISNETGEDIIGKVPTMRLLAAGKEGLDAELDKPQYHDPLTGSLNKAGVSLDAMRRAFLEELDKLNPAYKTARAQWSGDTASMQAVRYGERDWTNKRPEEIAADVAKMDPGDLEFARLGLAANLRKRMAQMGGSGNEARAVAGDKAGSWLRQQIRPFFRTDDEYNAFINSIDAENRMFAKGVKLAGGSDTAARQAEDFSADKGAHIAGGVSNAMSGKWFGAAYHGLKVLNPRIPEDVATEIASIVSDPQKSLQVLGGYKPPVRHPVMHRLAGPMGAFTAQELGLE